jgi:hypothetical protein
MKIEDMLQALPSREDIATAIGLRSQVFDGRETTVSDAHSASSESG